MKTTIFFIFTLLFYFNFSFGQAHHLEGVISVQLNEGIIESEMTISNFHIQTNKPTILLNYKYQVTEILWNGNTLPIPEKIPGDGFFEYIIPVGRIPTKEDKLSIKYKGEFNIYNQDNPHKNDFKGRIAFNYDILRASEQSKWYPMLLGTNDFNPVKAFNKTSYSYDIEIDCKDCKSAYIGQGSPQYNEGKNMIFISKNPLNKIMLIAGNFDWVEEERFYHINFTEENAANLKIRYDKIIAYFEEFSDLKFDTKCTIAACPSDKEWAFFTYPAIVYTNKKRIAYEMTLSHELAHYYFGHKYQFGKELYPFYSESFAEYYCIKYFINQGYKTDRFVKDLKSFKIANYIPFAKSKYGFVKMHKVKKGTKVGIGFRYSIGPFILLGIESEIGEEKMKAFIKELFSVNTSELSDYEHFIQSLRNIDVDEFTIKTIQKKYIKRFKIKNYLRALKIIKYRSKHN